MNFHSIEDRQTERMAEILGQVKRVFAEKGFDGASMQDLARACGMSAGNFYRYFPSKDAIIAAIVEQKLAEMSEAFATVLGSDDPEADFRRLLKIRLESVDDCSGPIWAEIESAARRRPDLMHLLERMEHSVRGNLTAVFARIAGTTEAEAEARFGSHILFVMLLVQGTINMASCIGASSHAPPEAALRVAGVAALVQRTIEGLLAEIAATPHDLPKA